MNEVYATWCIAVQFDRNTPLYATLYSRTELIDARFLKDEAAARSHPLFARFLKGVQEFCRMSNNNRVRYRISVCKVGQQPLFLHYQTPQTPLL